MREPTVVEWCDIEWKKEKVRVEATWTSVMEVSGKPRTLQLCLPHATERHTIGEWHELHAEYGWLDRDDNTPPHRPSKLKAVPVPVGGPPVTGGPSTQPLICPECGEKRANRKGVIDHMQSKHGIDKVIASHAVPPVGESVECEVCGFLTNVGPGYAGHVRADHGIETWEKIKSRR